MRSGAISQDDLDLRRTLVISASWKLARLYSIVSRYPGVPRAEDPSFIFCPSLFHERALERGWKADAFSVWWLKRSFLFLLFSKVDGVFVGLEGVRGMLEERGIESGFRQWEGQADGRR